MNNVYEKDLFISYSTENTDIAQYVVEKLEKRGLKCFIAPRDITSGNDYATEIINGISNSLAVLLVFSSSADKSGYVLREINSAVSRNKTIIPFRIENIVPSEAMEFYLGPTHWLDAFPNILESHLDSVENVLNGIKKQFNPPQKSIQIVGPKLLTIDQLLEIGYTYEKLTMRELELDYISLPQNKYMLDENLEGTFDDWIENVRAYSDSSCFIVKDDEIVAYTDIFPINDDDFEQLKTGQVMIRDEMVALYSFGGNFNVFIPLVAFEANYANQNICSKILNWIVSKIHTWEENNIFVNQVCVVAYSALVEKFVKTLGFEYTGTNPAKGKCYTSTISQLKIKPLIKKILLEA